MTIARYKQEYQKVTVTAYEYLYDSIFLYK
jgi:hypothetical protein